MLSNISKDSKLISTFFSQKNQKNRDHANTACCMNDQKRDIKKNAGLNQTEHIRYKYVPLVLFRNYLFWLSIARGKSL